MTAARVPKTHAAEQHRGQENHRQVRKLSTAVSASPTRDGAGDGRERGGDLSAQPLRIELQPGTAAGGRSAPHAGRHESRRPGAAHELVRQRAAEQAPPQSGARLAEHDLGHVLAPREAQDFGRIVAALKPHRIPAEPLGESEGLGDLVRLLGVALLADRLDGDRGPGGVEARWRAGRPAAPRARRLRPAPTQASRRSEAPHGPSIAFWRR